MAKPRQPKHNKPNISKGLGVEAVEAGGAEEKTGIGGDGGEGEERAAHNTTFPPRRATSRQRAGQPARRKGHPAENRGEETE